MQLHHTPYTSVGTETFQPSDISSSKNCDEHKYDDLSPNSGDEQSEYEENPFHDTSALSDYEYVEEWLPHTTAWHAVPAAGPAAAATVTVTPASMNGSGGLRSDLVVPSDDGYWVEDSESIPLPTASCAVPAPSPAPAAATAATPASMNRRSGLRSDLVPSDDSWIRKSVSHPTVPCAISAQIPAAVAATAAATPLSFDHKEAEAKRAHTNVLPPPPPTNVIIFGESGVGKSSIINMLVGEPVAAVSNQAVGCTFASTKFRAIIDDQEVMLYDTTGLDEAEAGTVSPEQAIKNLRSLVRELTTVNLLVYCIRGTRFRKIVADNYHMFRNMISGGGGRKVPVVLVITGLENEDDMEDWWNDTDNQRCLDQHKLKFSGHACITATRGRGYIFQDLYDVSQQKLKDLLADHAFRSRITIVPPEATRTPIRGDLNSQNAGRTRASVIRDALQTVWNYL